MRTSLAIAAALAGRVAYAQSPGPSLALNTCSGANAAYQVSKGEPRVDIEVAVTGAARARGAA
jgi:hypothetical protein